MDPPHPLGNASWARLDMPRSPPPDSRRPRAPPSRASPWTPGRLNMSHRPYAPFDRRKVIPPNRPSAKSSDFAPKSLDFTPKSSDFTHSL